MPPEQLDHAPTATLADLAKRAANRRDFLRLAGLGGAALCLPGFLANCADPLAPTVPNLLRSDHSAVPDVTLDFSSDFGVLNYAYALEQLEAAFYTRVKTSPPSDMNGHEQNVLRQVWAHEVIHAAFFKAALGAKAIPALTPNFSTINFNSRASVLATAKTFEDLGVAAYNGAGKFLKSAAYLTIAGKIVSVEARHAAAIRDLLQPRSRDFAGDDVIDSHGLDRAFEPPAVLQAAGAFVENKITIVNLPSTMA